MKLRILPLVLLVASALPSLASQTHALLVGVSDYDASVMQYAPPLSGPPNDVALMYAALGRLGVEAEHVTVLADGTPHAAYHPVPYATAEPTRRAILSHLARLSNDVDSGDFVIVFLAGHGAQVAATGPDEADGLDEIFLPKDFSISFDTGPPVLNNPIRDDELGQALAAITAAGASVWLIVDACHSGSFERSAGTMTPRVLSLPSQASKISASPAPAFASRNPMGNRAGFAGFYAAASDQLAFEGKLSGSADGPSHGLFTWALVKSMRQAADLRALSRLVGAELWRWGLSAPDPVFAGNLGLPLPGQTHLGEPGHSVQIGPDRISIAAGTLDGLGRGDVLAIEDATDTPVFFARVIAAGLTQSQAELIEGDLLWPDRSLSRLQAEGLPAALRDGWLRDRAALFTARLAEVSSRDGLRVVLPQDAAVATALTSQLGRSVVTTPNDRPDLVFRVDRDMLVAEWAGGQTVRLGSVSAPDTWRAPLQRLVRAATILRGAHAFAGASPVASLVARVGLWPEPEVHPCPAPSPRTTAPTTTRHVSPCDIVRITLHNRGPVALDVAPFYLGVDASLHYLSGYPNGTYLGLRLAPGQSETVLYSEDPGDTGGGRMFLVFLAETVTDPEIAPKDYRRLAAASPATRGDAPSSFAAWFGGGHDPVTRGSTIGEPDMGAIILPLVVQEAD